MIRRLKNWDPEWVRSGLRDRLMGEGEFVAVWLNDKTKRGAQGKERIRKLLVLLQELQNAAAAYPGLPHWQIPGAVAVEGELQKLTSHYQGWPRYYIVGPRFTGDTAANGVGVTHMFTRGGLEETQALMAIEQLARAGMLDRLALCQTCKEHWVFRRKSDRKYCSVKCRQADYEASPRRKKLKAKKNREYYERWLKGRKKNRRKVA